MPSVQSYVVKFWIRRFNLLHVGNASVHAVRFRSEFAAGLLQPHRDVDVIPVDANGVPSEWLIPPRVYQESALLYIHGGAWYMGSTKTHRALVSKLAFKSETAALSINYRLAPDYPFPAGLNDCVTAYKWLLESGIAPKKIMVAGDSAGGNLTLALLIALRDHGIPLPAGAVAMSPVTDLAFTGESIYTQKHLDPIFAKATSISTVLDYITDHDPRHPLISPLYAELKGLPPILLHVGDHEILRDDSVRFAERAKAAGVDVEMVVWPNMFHDFQIASTVLPEARLSIELISTFIASHLDDPWPNIDNI